MSAASTMRIIEQEVEAKWGSTTPIAYPNVAFTPPTTGSWLKLDFVWGTGTLVTKDSWNRTTGLLQLAVFSPKGNGNGAGAALAEQTRAIFNRRRLASPFRSVMFGASSGPVTRFEESWCSFVVTVPFQVEEFAPAPPDIPGLVLWLTADSFWGYENLENIARWPDLSGHGNDAVQASLTRQPTVQKNVVAGHPIARFDGNDWLDADPLITTIPAAHSIIVVATATTGAVRTLWHGYVNPQLGERHTWTPAGLLTMDTEPAVAGVAHAETAVPSLMGTWHVVHVHMPATGYARFFLDDVEYAPTATSGAMVSSPLTRLRVGAENSATPFYWVGDMAEVLVYDHPLTDTERGTALDVYMSSRYGL